MSLTTDNTAASPVQTASANHSVAAEISSHSHWYKLALALIILFNVLGSLYWLRQNTVLIGNDASGYLSDTLDYARFFTPISLESLFRAFTLPAYRTPGLFIAVQPFYWLFGVSMDSAQLVNVVALAGLVWITYGLGCYAVGPGVGLFSAALVGLLPMVFAMARLFYTELPLAALVALNLLALAQSDGFQRRRWSLVWGVSLGLGLLVKWALPIYVLLPTLWLFWRAGLLQLWWRTWRTWRVDSRALAIAAVTSLALTALWFFPNRAAMGQFVLGDGLFVGWFLLGLLWVYTLQLRATPTSNWWLGLLTGAILASPWYLPHVDFVTSLVAADQTRGDVGATPLSLYNYVRYFSFFYTFHIGALAAWVIVPTALAPWLWALVTRRPLPARSAMLWLSLLSTYLVLALLAQSSPRFLVPILPSMTVLAAIGLWHYRPWLRVTLGVVWIVILGLQWSIFTLDALGPLFVRTEALWTSHSYSVQPNSFVTDPRYEIGPEVLARIAAENHPEVQRIGMLVNTPQLHRGVFKYLIAAENRPVEVATLTETDSPGWLGLLSSQWVLVKDGDNHDVEAPGLALIQRVLGGDPLFHSLYREVARYPLPDGETAILFHRPVGPGRPTDLPLQLEQTEAVAAAIRQAWSSHANLIYSDPGTAVWVGAHDPATERVHVLSKNQGADESLLAGLNDTLLVVWNADAQALSDWMNQNAYRAFEVGDDFASVAIYGRPQQPLTTLDAKAAWPNVTLQSLRSQPTLAAGQVLPLEITVASGAEQGLKLSLRLLDAAGAVVASHDRPLQAQDRLGLFVPPDVAPGSYTVAALLYDPVTGTVVPTVAGDETAQLATIQVTP